MTTPSPMDSLKAKAVVVSQGKAVVQPDSDCAGRFMVMFPDGCVVNLRGKTAVIRELNTWARKQPLPPFGVGVLTVEWQGMGRKEVTTPMNFKTEPKPATAEAVPPVH